MLMCLHVTHNLLSFVQMSTSHQVDARCVAEETLQVSAGLHGSAGIKHDQQMDPFLTALQAPVLCFCSVHKHWGSLFWALQRSNVTIRVLCGTGARPLSNSAGYLLLHACSQPRRIFCARIVYFSRLSNVVVWLSLSRVRWLLWWGDRGMWWTPWASHRKLPNPLPLLTTHPIWVLQSHPVAGLRLAAAADW